MSIIYQNQQLFNQNNINISTLCNTINESSKNYSINQLLASIKQIDDEYFYSNEWKENYTSNGFVKRTIITSIGSVTFRRRYYMSKDITKHDNFYYVDSILEIPTRKHLTNDALALIFTMATEYNSSIAARSAIPGVIISKQTVSVYEKNATTLVDNNSVIKDVKTTEIKSFDVIYIEADEAHCNLQHDASYDDSSDEIKVSTKDNKRVNKKNIINKLTLIHSGIKNPELRLKRHELANKHYFGGIHIPPEDLSDNVCDYILDNYSLNTVKYIFVSGDGANWIKSFTKNIKHYFNYTYSHIEVVQVLDKHHYYKNLRSIFNNSSTTTSSIDKMIKDKDNPMSSEEFENFCFNFYTSNGASYLKLDSFKSKVHYISNNLEYIRNQNHPFYNCPASMEGQISHVLAEVFTSRPKGFCEPVLQNLTQMRLFIKNGNVITDEIVSKWMTKYTPIKYPKYLRKNKSYKYQFSMKAEMPIDYISDTNIRNFISRISYPKFN